MRVSLEDGDEEVDEEDVGDDEVDGHDSRSDPAAGDALLQLGVRVIAACRCRQVTTRFIMCSLM